MAFSGVLFSNFAQIPPFPHSPIVNDTSNGFAYLRTVPLTRISSVGALKMLVAGIS